MAARTRKSPRSGGKSTSTHKATKSPRTRKSSAKPAAKQQKQQRRKADAKRPVSPRQTWLITTLLGKVKGEFGFEQPRNSAEANAQIRTMLGVEAAASRQATGQAMKRVLGTRGVAKPPIASRKALAAFAAKVRI